eukprot:7083011-Lingulodinium_polyedra.AAC.1
MSKPCPNHVQPCSNRVQTMFRPRADHVQTTFTIPCSNHAQTMCKPCPNAAQCCGQIDVPL